MKNVFLFLLQIPLFAYAQSFLQVYDNGKILYPDNFLNSNGIVQVDSNGVFKYPFDLLSKNGIVQVESTGNLAYPDKATFAQKNDLVPTTNLSVFVDLYRDGVDDVSGMRISGGGKSVYWSDCELKVLDKDGKIIYFFSTIAFANKQVQALHDSKYNDNNATVYYYVSGGNTNGVCVKPKKKLTNFNSSIGAIENAHNGTSDANDNKVRITAIQIYPSAKFLDAFLNPENSIMVWRQSINSAETDGKGAKTWRPAIIQFIR